MGEPFIENEQYIYEPGNNANQEGNDDDDQNVSCCCSFFRVFFWLFLCGGLPMSILWFITGLLYCCWFRKCFVISRYLLLGMCDHRVGIKTKCKCYDSQGRNEQNCCCDACFVTMWMLIFGWSCTLLHLVFGLLS